MLAISLLTWWYGQGWSQVLDSLKRRLHQTVNVFSINTLLGTLWAPWRRIVSVPGNRLIDHFYAALDNFISRCIGCVVRLFVLLAAVLTLLSIAIASLLELAVWPLLPPLALAFLIKGLISL